MKGVRTFKGYTTRTDFDATTGKFIDVRINLETSEPIKSNLLSLGSAAAKGTKSDRTKHRIDYKSSNVRQFG